MDLTPELLRTVEFNDAKKGGYDHDEVDEFLDRAAADLARQHTALRDLEARVGAAEKRAAEAEESARDHSDSDETLRRTLVLAQRTADAAIKEAQDDGERIVAEARTKADGLIAAAEEQVRRDVGATRDRLQAEIRDLEGRRTELKGQIAEMTAHVDAERERIRGQVDELRDALDGDALRVAPYEGVELEPLPEEPAETVDEAPAPAPTPVADEVTAAPGADEDLADLPPPPVDWSPEPEAPPSRPSLFEAPAEEARRAPDVDLSEGGPPTEAAPVVPGGAGVGSSHLDELRRAVSDGPDAPDDDDAAMAAFFDQDDDDERSRRFGRRR